MANITFCKARFTLWPGERSGPARMHRRSNLAWQRAATPRG